MGIQHRISEEFDGRDGRFYAEILTEIADGAERVPLIARWVDALPEVVEECLKSLAERGIIREEDSPKNYIESNTGADMPTPEQIRIGAGAAFAADRIDPAVKLARDAQLDYLGFECLAEVNLGLENYRKAQGESPGYNTLLEARMRRVLPHTLENDVTVVTNMGSAAPEAAAERTAEIATDLGLDATVAAVAGSDVSDQFEQFEGSPTFENEDPAAYEDTAISANAYMGVDGIVEALASSPDVVITDRVSDVSLFLAPMIHEFGWQHDDPATTDPTGQGIVTSHLMECAGHITGGYFADPGYKDVDGLDELGFPIAEVSADGDVEITKLPDTGGEITERTCKEQLLYEIHDPAAYITPDGIADFTGVEFEAVGPDRVRVTGGESEPRPEKLKVNVAYKDGAKVQAGLGYAGPGALERAQLAGEVVRGRLEKTGADYEDLRIDHLGVDSMHGDLGANRTDTPPYEVRLRVAAMCETEREAGRIAHEVTSLATNGPAGGGGMTRSIEPVIGVVSTLLDRTAAEHRVSMYTASEDDASQDVTGDATTEVEA